MIEISPIEYVLIILCVSHILEVWRHGEITEELRARIEASPYAGTFFGRLVRCCFCLSVWLTGMVVLLLAIRPFFPPTIRVYYVPIISFLILTGALTRAANILHDLVRPWSRTPHSKAREENVKMINKQIND